MVANILNAPDQISNAAEGARPTVETSSTRARRRWFASKTTGDLRIYQHSNLLYWWPIWVCAVKRRHLSSG
jgi:hypothetical protein